MDANDRGTRPETKRIEGAAAAPVPKIAKVRQWVVRQLAVYCLHTVCKTG